MKKYRIIVLIFAAILVFTSCVTQKDIEAKEDLLQELEEEFEAIEEEYEALENEYESLSDKLAGLTKLSNELEAANKEASAEVEKLKAKVPNPPFLFLLEEYIDNVTEAIEGSNKGITFKRAFSNDLPEENKLGSNKLEYVYELKGSADTDKYIVLTFITGYGYDEVYDITVKYSSDVYLDDYNELVQILITALVMITEDPYYYDREYFDTAEDILEEGDYFNGYMIIDQTSEGETGMTKMFCRNY